MFLTVPSTHDETYNKGTHGPESKIILLVLWLKIDNKLWSNVKNNWNSLKNKIVTACQKSEVETNGYILHGHTSHMAILYTNNRFTRKRRIIDYYIHHKFKSLISLVFVHISKNEFQINFQHIHTTKVD